MTRTYSRRAAMGVLGTGLAALTGATTRLPRCVSFTGAARADCRDGADLSLDGPESASVSAPESNPRFVLANEDDELVALADVDWHVYRREDDWTRVADGRGASRIELGADEGTTWALMVRSQEGAQAFTTSSLDAGTTRYVGPAMLSPGPHAFVVTGQAGDRRVEAVARFDVTR